MKQCVTKAIKRFILLCMILGMAIYTAFPGTLSAAVPSLDADGASSGGTLEEPDLSEIPDELGTNGTETEYRTTASGIRFRILRPSSPGPAARRRMGTRSSDALCLMLLPETDDITDFPEQIELLKLTALEQMTVVCVSAQWERQEDADGCLEEIWQELQGTVIRDSTAVFLTGYDEAADYAAREALLHTTRYEGLVTFGGEGLEEDFLERQAKDAPLDHALSVWMIAPRKTKLLQKNISFWKEWNGIEDTNRTTYQSTFASELYLPRTSAFSDIDREITRMGTVLFSRCEEYREASICSDVFRFFFAGVRSDEISFRESITGGELIRINDMHFSYHRVQTDGQQRDYWTYVPDSAIQGTEPASLILCLHGNGGSGEEMIFRSMWHHTAAKNNCIVLYPSSLYRSGSQHYWLNIKEEIDFLRNLVSETCERFSIDRSHIYVTGFSNGAGMAQNLAVRCSDLFAAATLSAPVYFDEEYFIGPIEEVHPVAILFSYGTEDKYLKEYQVTAEIDDIPAQRHLEYWRGLYGFQQDFYRRETKGKFTIYTFCSINQVPVCQWIIVDGKTHDYPEEETSIYYAFMKQFSKGENGELYYNGKQVEAFSIP